MYDKLIDILKIAQVNITNQDLQDQNIIELLFLVIGILKNMAGVEEIRRIKLTKENVIV